MIRYSLAILSICFLAGCAKGTEAKDRSASDAKASACTDSNAPVAVEGAWLRPVASAGGNTAAYFVLCNNGDAPVAIVGASSGIASATEIHRTERDENDVVRMAPAGDVTIAPGDHAIFEPGGLHVMLMGVTAPLEEGASQPLILQLADGDVVELFATVQRTPPQETPSSDEHGDHAGH